MQEEGKVTIGYWKIRGLVERIRMILQYIGLPYQQEFYTSQTRAQWFSEIKPKLQTKNPAITLPYLVDGERIISQSDAIIVYVIHKSGKTQLLGRNSEEQVRIATVMGVVRDLHVKYITLSYGRWVGNKTFQQAKAQFLQESRAYLIKLNGLLEGRQFYAGQITWIDFVVAEFVQCLWLLERSLIQSYPNVLKQQIKIWELPQIQSYHKTERWSERPINNPGRALWL